MARQPVEPGGSVDWLLGLLDQAFDHKAWHGPNLRGAVLRVSAAQACWRPAPGRHSIAEQVLHAAYWKYTVRRRLTGEKRGSFVLAGSNWFPLPEDLEESAWKGHLRLLDSEHRSLRAAVSALDPRRLGEVPDGSKYRLMDLIVGIAAHDIYHAAQIQLLKRLAPER